MTNNNIQTLKSLQFSSVRFCFVFSAIAKSQEEVANLQNVHGLYKMSLSHGGHTLSQHKSCER